MNENASPNTTTHKQLVTHKTANNVIFPAPNELQERMMIE